MPALLLALLPVLACVDKGGGATSDDSGLPTGDGGATTGDGGTEIEPAPPRPAEPPAWEAPGTVDDATFPWGPQSGDPSQEGVILSLRTDLEQVTAVLMADDGAGGWVEVGRPVLTREEGALVARATVEGLSADTVHAWAAWAGDPDLAGARSRVGRFRTATGDDAFRQLTIAATSCLGGNEPLSNMSAVAAMAPDLTLLLGDTVYADGATSLEDYRTFWTAAFAVQGLQDTVAGSGLVPAWDDHEVENNYVVADLDPGQYDAALQAFRESLPQGQGPTGAVWRQQSWGALLDIFVLDVRGERDVASGLYIGAEQEAWLLSGLEASTATFKLVVTSVPVTDYEDFLGPFGEEDRWQGWPEQRERVLQAIEDAQVEGVLWLAGDVHFATVSTLGVPGDGSPGGDRWEVVVGPAGRSPNVAADLYEHDGSHYLFMFSSYNTALLTFDPARLQVTVSFVGDDGAPLAETTLAL